LHQGHGGEVVFEKLAQGAFFLQPSGGGALAAGGAHPADDVAESLGTLPPVEAGFLEDLGNLEVPESFQRDVFSPHGPGFDLLDGIDIHFLEVMAWRGAVLIVKGFDFASSSDDLGIDMLRAFFDRRIDRKECLFGVEDLLDAGAEFRPDTAGEVEIRTQVEQGVLAHFLADSFGFDEAVGEIGAAGAGGSRLGLANEHDPEDWQVFWPEATAKLKLWHYIHVFKKKNHWLSTGYSSKEP